MEDGRWHWATYEEFLAPAKLEGLLEEVGDVCRCLGRTQSSKKVTVDKPSTTLGAQIE